jgi:hypothetical protein
MLLVCAFGIVTWAQQSSALSQPHQQQAPNVIDGSAHPELIPDSVAYRLYLVAVSTAQNPTEAEQARQRAQITRTGLVSIDQQLFINILSDFRTKYDALVTEYNDGARAAAARNETADVHALLRKIDDLVQSTRDAIGVRLSSKGAEKLYTFVVSEKKNMKMTEDN